MTEREPYVSPAAPLLVSSVEGAEFFGQPAGTADLGMYASIGATGAAGSVAPRGPAGPSGI